MITFKCPRCSHSIEALDGRLSVSCESCGEIVPVPAVSEVDTLTLEELKALRTRGKIEPSKYL